MEIWAHRNGQYAGRFSESAMREKIADGTLSPADLAWDEAKSAWQPISEFLAPSASSASSAPISDIRPAAVKESTPSAESIAPEARHSGPPPLPSIAASVMPMPASGPPPLPTPVFSPAGSSASASAAGAHQPPEGETIWSPYMAILGSLFLS